jgi:Protein of unknown function (DUF2510)
MSLLSSLGAGQGQGPRVTINGHSQNAPEVLGSLRRRNRLFIECTRLLAGDRLASEASAGTPIGGGIGIESLVAKIEPLFSRERSLIRWIALRGAFTDMYVHTVDTASRVTPFYPVVETVMGVGNLYAPGAAEEVIDIAPEWAAQLTVEQRTSAVTLFAGIQARVFDYERYSKMDIDDVNRDRNCHLSDQIALNFIAWTAVALLRLGIAQSQMTAPEPDALEQPGWYADPLWGDSDRYWDGADWTSRCRAPSGKEGLVSLHPTLTEI